MKKRFRALRIVSFLYKLVAILGFIGSIGGAVLFYSQTGQDVDPALVIPPIIGIIVGGLVSAIILFGLGQLFDLFIALEENTRATSALLQRLGRVMQDRL
ncbi:MAG: hypothetical protein SGI73_20250 [Chloroflexota bacterium]|nr:hypothetical protein [Chloroflexota bacterium]